ncbi:hypothetical protein PR048_003294 [Dryococelus australis]|uniref:Transposase n=1 Tax=Dryococelus australis TaxID=614101 RepID=A0ABQ9INL3_9NEOP|nr:hypothetical protein PR048_003294 [Dryococelus australis]
MAVLHNICPDSRTFEAIHRPLRKHGTLKPDTGKRRWPRWTKMLELEEAVLRVADENPSVNTRKVATALNVDHTVAWRNMHVKMLYP